MPSFVTIPLITASSVHYLDRCDPFYDKQAIYRTLPIYTRVINVVADSAKAVPEARIIGHDFFSRYATENHPDVHRQAPMPDRLFRIMRKWPDLEINAGTIDSDA